MEACWFNAAIRSKSDLRCHLRRAAGYNLPKELVRWLLLTTTLPKSYDSIFISHFSLTVFRRFHEKWRETTLKNSEIF